MLPNQGRSLWILPAKTKQKGYCNKSSTMDRRNEDWLAWWKTMRNIPWMAFIFVCLYSKYIDKKVATGFVIDCRFGWLGKSVTRWNGSGKSKAVLLIYQSLRKKYCHCCKWSFSHCITTWATWPDGGPKSFFMKKWTSQSVSLWNGKASKKLILRQLRVAPLTTPKFFFAIFFWTVGSIFLKNIYVWNPLQFRWFTECTQSKWRRWQNVIRHAIKVIWFPFSRTNGKTTKEHK